MTTDFVLKRLEKLSTFNRHLNNLFVYQCVHLENHMPLAVLLLAGYLSLDKGFKPGTQINRGDHQFSVVLLT